MKKGFFITLFVVLLFNFCCGATYRYFCPSPNDFKNYHFKNELNAATDFYKLKHYWKIINTNSTGYPEFPLTFKGTKLRNCSEANCEVICLYYSNIEGHDMQAISDNSKNSIKWQISPVKNAYLIQNFCQFTEHVDCPFYVDI